MEEGNDYKIIKALEDWKAKEGDLPEPLQLYRESLAFQTEAKSRIDLSGLRISRELINERIQQGRPALSFDDLRIDWEMLKDVLNKVASLFDGYTDTPGKQILSACSASAGSLELAAKAWFNREQMPAEIIDGADENLTELVFSAALKPFLARHSEYLLSLVNQELWRRGYCPICGGSPDFASLDKESGTRRMLCSRCDTRWLFQRMECHNCGNQNQDDLAYFTDEKGLYRLYVCERCKCYLKVVDLRQTADEVLLPLERFITLDLDRQAQEKGYITCSGSKKVALTREGG